MARLLGSLLSDAVTIGIGASSLAAEKGKQTLDSLKEKGQEVREEHAELNFEQDSGDAFARAENLAKATTDYIKTLSGTTNNLILEELIRTRLQNSNDKQRAEFIQRVLDIIDEAKVEEAEKTEHVEAEVVEEQPEAEYIPCNQAEQEKEEPVVRETEL